MQSANYLELLPKVELQPLIKCFWISVNNSDSALYLTTLPDGCFEIVVIYQEQVLKDLILSGILTKPYDMVMTGRELKIGIRMNPLGKEYYLDKCRTLDRFAEFAKTFSGDILNDLQKFSELVTADIQQVVQIKHIDKRKLILFDLLQQTSGNIDVKTLSEHCCWSSRQINRYFTKQLGIPLKTYSNILKCYAAYTEIKAGHLNPDLGYYDQSHFIREIRKHTGTTPKTLLKNEAQRFLQFNERVSLIINRD